MKKLVVIGANDFQNQLILKAKSLGYETHVFAWEDGAVGKKNADFFYPVSIIEKKQILEKCKEIKPDGICSIASDLAVNTVCYVSEKMGLNSNTYESVLACTNKFEMRKKLSEHKVPTPKFIKASNDETTWKTDDMIFPVIVKPTDRSGSRGINKITDKNQIEAAVKDAVSNSFENAAIIEEYIEGNEYSCECISYKGKHHFLAFTKKYTTGAPHFIETGHVEPSDIPMEYQQNIKDNIFKALTALGITDGASHSEFKVDKNGRMGIIEIGARMGGDCIGSDLVYLSTGYDFMKMIIDVSCGIEPQMIKTGKEHTAHIKFIFNTEDLKRLETIKQDSNVKIYRISEINMDNLDNITDSSNRLGYYITLED